MKRAYGSEPVLFSASPITSTAPNPYPKQRGKQRIILLLAGSLLIVTIVVLSLMQQRHPDVIPASLRQSTAYPLYSPGWLPEGMRVNPSSFDATSQVVTFSFSYDSGKKLIFTEQPKPEGFDFNNFYEEQLADKRTVDTAVGSATIGLFEGSSFASVVTDKTWVIMRAPSGIDSNSLARVISGLRKED